MTYTEQWIRDAIEGGWRANVDVKDCLPGKYNSLAEALATRYEKILLDPRAWQAVGKTRGWEQEYVYKINVPGSKDGFQLDGGWSEPEYMQHHFLDRLIAGKTPEEALKEIS